MFITNYLTLDPHLLAAAELVDSVRQGTNTANLLANGFWSEIFKGGIFGRVVDAAKIIALFGICYRGWQMVNEYQNNNFDVKKLIMALVGLLLTWSLLAQNGANAMYLVNAARNLSGNISDRVLNGLAHDFDTKGLKANVDEKLAALQPFQDFDKALKSCAPMTADPAMAAVCNFRAVVQLKASLQKAGVKDADTLNKVNAMEQQARDNVAKAQGNQPVDDRGFLEQAGSAIAHYINPVNWVYDFVSTLLMGFTIMFFFAIDLAMILFGFLFPINLALSFFSGDPLKSWISNFWTLGNAKICYAIITGIITYFRIWGEKSGGTGAFGAFVVELLLAVAAPFITFFYCQGSALALAGAINSVGYAPARAVGGMFGKAVSLGVNQAGKRVANNAIDRIAAWGKRSV
jgi:hypothetical protein